MRSWEAQKSYEPCWRDSDLLESLEHGPVQPAPVTLVCVVSVGGVEPHGVLPSLLTLSAGPDAWAWAMTTSQPGLDSSRLPVGHGKGPDQSHLLQPVHCSLLASQDRLRLCRGLHWLSSRNTQAAVSAGEWGVHMGAAL